MDEYAIKVPEANILILELNNGKKFDIYSQCRIHFVGSLF